MHKNHISPFKENEPRHGVCVVDGHGAKLYVNRGHLVVEDGAGRQRRTRHFHKATSGISRVVMLARSGFVTIDAIQWLTDAGIGLIHLDPNGRLLVSSTHSSAGGSLRRAQARAADNQVGIEVIRDILTSKLLGQTQLVGQIDTTAAARIEWFLTDLADADSLPEMSKIEAAAAGTYWATLAGLPVEFVRADVVRVPGHWRPRRKAGCAEAASAAGPASGPVS